ncbi:MAG: thiamine pyrophosphate-binding protein [Thermincola sp.]|jgi:thiamine pyrophosphate-dependent acetolactate synthase large subunit-like protein|nr:thiamine pyrophosphate-binding protein [Thermincola sp.]MDT3703923.1 thiamine pyrophosphate-binding protein [Thermincola sp.]
MRKSEYAWQQSGKAKIDSEGKEALMVQNITVAEALIKFLSLNGLNTIFGVLGDAVFPFFDALGKQTEIKYYGAAHESSAAFMASYHAKLTGKAGVCVATSGPGCANLINGLADAYFDQAPVLVITGQVQTQKLGTNAKQYINQQALMQAVSKSSELVTNADSVIPVAARALAKAVSEQTVTHVSIPVDLFTQRISDPKFPEIAAKNTAQWGSGYAAGLEDAVALIQSSRKILMMVGKGKPEWRKTFFDLAVKLNAGIILAQQAKGLLPDNHPNVIGGIGEAYAPTLLQEADCILLFGNASFEKRFLPAQAKIIQIADTQESIDYSIMTKGIVGDLRQIIKVLIERVDPDRNQNWLNKIECEKQNLDNLIRNQELNNTTPIHPAHLMTILHRVVPGDSVIICDVGGFMHWFDTYFRAQNHTVLLSSHWRSMGGGLPGAISACISQVDKKVIALVGDGGLMMSLGEVATAVKYQLPVCIVIANNHQYNLEKSKMEAQGLLPFGHDPAVPDFAVLARAFGCEGRVVSKADQLASALTEALGSSKPFVVDVHLNNATLPFLS